MTVDVRRIASAYIMYNITIKHFWYIIIIRTVILIAGSRMMEVEFLCRPAYNRSKTLFANTTNRCSVIFRAKVKEGAKIAILA